MKKATVISKKYDGTHRDEYETFLYAETDQTITLFSIPGLKYWDFRKGTRMKAQDGLIEIYFKNKWYNVWHICEQVSQTNLIYVNIAMPVTIQDTAIEWIDLDLDYRMHLDNSVERLDQEEFDTNSQLMKYPSDLILQVQNACKEVEAGLTNQAYPFDYKKQVKLYYQIKANLLGSDLGGPVQYTLT